MSIKMNELEGLSKKAEELEIIRRARKACAYFKSAQLTIQHDHFQMKKANETDEFIIPMFDDDVKEWLKKREEQLVDFLQSRGVSTD